MRPGRFLRASAPFAIGVLIIDAGWMLPASAVGMSPPLQVAAAQSCKTVSSCREAVVIWCNGYRRADGDNDGIPCENVCSDLDQVNEIRASIGC